MDRNTIKIIFTSSWSTYRNQVDFWLGPPLV